MCDYSELRKELVSEMNSLSDEFQKDEIKGKISNIDYVVTDILYDSLVKKITAMDKSVPDYPGKQILKDHIHKMVEIGFYDMNLLEQPSLWPTYSVLKIVDEQLEIEKSIRIST
jgi:hypothetical protein